MRLEMENDDLALEMLSNKASLMSQLEKVGSFLLTFCICSILLGYVHIYFYRTPPPKSESCNYQRLILALFFKHMYLFSVSFSECLVYVHIWNLRRSSSFNVYGAMIRARATWGPAPPVNL